MPILFRSLLKKITKEQEDVTESIKEDLLFDDKSLDKILGNTDAKICKSSGDFEQLIKTINSIKPNYVDINVKQLYHLINDKSLESKDVFWILYSIFISTSSHMDKSTGSLFSSYILYST